MSPPGRHQGDYRRAKHEATPWSAMTLRACAAALSSALLLFISPHARPQPLPATIHPTRSVAGRRSRRDGAELGARTQCAVAEGLTARPNTRRRIAAARSANAKDRILRQPARHWLYTSGRTKPTSAACGAAPRCRNRRPRPKGNRARPRRTGAPRTRTGLGRGHLPGPSYRHCMLSLSRGRRAAKVVREFDAGAAVRERRLHAAGSQSDVDGRRDTLTGHRFRPRFDRLGTRASSSAGNAARRSARRDRFEGEAKSGRERASTRHRHERTLFFRALDSTTTRAYCCREANWCPWTSERRFASFMRAPCCGTCASPLWWATPLRERLAAAHQRRGLPAW